MTGATSPDQANLDCTCVTLDLTALLAQLDRDVDRPGFGAALARSHPHLFAASPVFLAPSTLAAMRAVVAAIESAARNPAFQRTVLGWAPAIAQRDFGPLGALMGYDFHLTDRGPMLIEVNTNAGGAFLNAALAAAQQACCAGTMQAGGDLAAGFAERAAAMFEREWLQQRGSGRPGTIAIVDEEPQAQHLLPEFMLAKAQLERRGFAVKLTDPGELAVREGRLWHGDDRIDLVYNRLVDFALEQPANATLREAYARAEAVVTPNPHLHALMADKRNLTLLSDEDALRALGLAEETVRVLAASVPRTVEVTPDRAAALWADRRNLFFKPARGYGSRATYSGAKLTRRVWDDIVGGGFIAQAFAAPGRRRIVRDGVAVELKVDVRLYTYAGEVMLVAARLYQGQTTNMRTAGGGFAPVLEMSA